VISDQWSVVSQRSAIRFAGHRALSTDYFRQTPHPRPRSGNGGCETGFGRGFSQL